MWIGRCSSFSVIQEFISYNAVMKKIPIILLYSRLLFVFIIITLTHLQPDYTRSMVLTLMYAGILTDIFDGIIARKLKVSTKEFRLLDTLFDLLFYFSIFYYLTHANPESLRENAGLVGCVLGLEFMMYAVSVIRFGKLPSPHAVLSKFWGLYLIVEFSLLILAVPGTHFTIALLVGLFVHLDRVLIYVLLKSWDHDIPSSYHALMMRQGKPIRRMKIFNG